MPDTPLTPVATLTQSLRALEIIRDGDARRLLEKGRPKAAIAHTAIIDNARLATIRLAIAVKAAVAGDLEPARSAACELRLDQMEVR